jgi:hypothetical protein
MSIADVVSAADPLGPTAVVIASSSLAPEALRGKPQDALLVLMTGRELGIGPMQALRMVTVIRGRVTLSADATIALVRRSDQCIEWRMVESTAERATYSTTRRGDTSPTVLTWTMEQARVAGLVRGGGQWQTYPEAMLRARCAAALARIVYPDLVAGVYDPDELAGTDATVATSRPAPTSTPAPESPDERRDATARILAHGDDAAEWVEEQLQRDGLDIGTAPLGRVRGAASYLDTQRGADALAAWRAKREEALNAPVEYPGENGHE